MMWAQIVNALLGVWLMASPGVLGYSGTARINDVIVGPVAATIAIIALWEVTRAVGKANVALGIWLIVAPWVLGYELPLASTNQFVVGLIMAALAMTRGQIHGKFGGGWRSLVRRAPPA